MRVFALALTATAVAASTHCGAGWTEANACGGSNTLCTGDADCPAGEQCFADLSDCPGGGGGGATPPGPAPAPGPAGGKTYGVTGTRCGSSWGNAKGCVGSQQDCTLNEDCPAGESCFSALGNICGTYPPTAPPTTAEGAACEAGGDAGDGAVSGGGGNDPLLQGVLDTYGELIAGGDLWGLPNADHCEATSNSIHVELCTYKWEHLKTAINHFNAGKSGAARFLDTSGSDSIEQGMMTLSAFLANIQHETAHWSACKERVQTAAGCPALPNTGGCSGGHLGHYTSAISSSNGWTQTTCRGATKPSQGCHDYWGNVVAPSENCWFGRGPIQTSWPGNYHALQPTWESLMGIDVCADPDSICSTEPGKEHAAWVSAIVFWKNNEGPWVNPTTSKFMQTVTEVVRPADGSSNGARQDQFNAWWSQVQTVQSSKKCPAGYTCDSPCRGTASTCGGTCTKGGVAPPPPATAAPTPSPTDAPTPSPTGAPAPSPTDAPTPSPTGAPTPSPTDAATPSPTRAPSPAPTKMPTPSPTGAPTPPPTDAATPPAQTPSPTSVPTPSPTGAPTPSPTDAATPQTPSPTTAPTPSPTANPTPSPTRAPTPSPTAGGGSGGSACCAAGGCCDECAGTHGAYDSWCRSNCALNNCPASHCVDACRATGGGGASATPSPTGAPTPSPTIAPTPSPTDAASPSTPSPTGAPTPSPTDAATPQTPSPTNAPTPSPTTNPTPSPTRAPTPSPTAGGGSGGSACCAAGGCCDECVGTHSAYDSWCRSSCSYSPAFCPATHCADACRNGESGQVSTAAARSEPGGMGGAAHVALGIVAGLVAGCAGLLLILKATGRMVGASQSADEELGGTTPSLSMSTPAHGSYQEQGKDAAVHDV